VASSPLVEAGLVLGVRLRVVLLKNSCMLGQQSLFLHLDDVALALLFCLLEFLFGLLGLALGLVDGELLLP